MTIQNDYGEKDWEVLWRKLEQEGNVGIDYVINPYLYNEMAYFLGNKPHSQVVDFGAGTNILGIQFFYGYQAAIPWLKTIPNLQNIRKNIDGFTGLEGSTDLVQKGKNYLKDLGYPRNIDISHFEIKSGNRSDFEDGWVTLALSRNFIMHLSGADLDYHFEEVARVLKADGSYIFATLNPAYERKKYHDLHPNEELLQAEEKYSFAHGSNGEYGVFHHYWRNQEAYEAVFAEHFTIESRTDCLPITNEFESTHPRYYQKDLPMAFVYHIKKK